jgi:hypothetical protein
VSAPAPNPNTWGACRFCGVAAPANAKVCPICGAEAPLSAAEIPHASRPVRRRLWMTSALRMVIVLGVSLALIYATASAVIAGPPVAQDPLTTAGMYAIGAGNYTVISGEITGGDFVLGNLTAVSPPGVNVTVAVYNSTQWAVWISGGLAGAPQWSPAPGPVVQIIYSAEYTDTFYFVFGNPYPVASHLTIDVYIVTEYYSNAVSDGFGD